MIRDAVLDTQEDVEEIKEDIKSIETYILNKKWDERWTNILYYYGVGLA